MSDAVAFEWHTLGGEEGRLLLPRLTTVGEIADLLSAERIAIEMDGKVHAHHADRPLLRSGSRVRACVVRSADPWPSAVSGLRCKLLPDTDADGMLRELLLAPAEEGVRATVRQSFRVRYVLDGRYVFFAIPNTYDVWFSYAGNASLDGLPVQPESVWLHAHLHAPLERIEPARDFCLPVAAGQYTSLHLRFELADPPQQVGTMAFDASVGVVQLPLRGKMREHAARRWALLDGQLAWSSEPACFLDARVLVLDGGPFDAPAPHLYEYRAEDGEVRFGRSKNRHGWHRSVYPYVPLQIFNLGPASWAFRLLARPL